MKIASRRGDGIGPEIMVEAVRVLDVLRGDGVPIETEAALRRRRGVRRLRRAAAESDARPRRSIATPCSSAPWAARSTTASARQASREAILGLAQGSATSSRTCGPRRFPELADASSLKPEVVSGLDLMIIRELTGDIYFGQPRGVSGEKGERVGINTMHYTEPQIRRILHVGFKTARQRGKRLTSIDKMNVLETTQLWRDIAEEIAPEYPTSSFRICLWITAPCNWCATRAIRRDRDRQHVRRHPFRRGLDADGLDRHAAVRVPRRERQGPLRADPRLGARHRRQGRRQSARDDPVDGDDVPLHLRPAPTSRRASRRRCAPRSRRACAPPTSHQGQTVATTVEMGTAVVKAL
jgi:hypothetical protein